MAAYQFGIVGATNLEDGTYGLLQNLNYNYSSEESVAQNAVGEVVDQTIYNKVTEIDCEYKLDTDLTLPVVGDEITVGATDVYRVMSVTTAAVNTEYLSGTINLKKYTTIPTPANA